MPIKVRCPSCKKVLNAPDAARGKAVRCSGCQSLVKIPAEVPADPDKGTAETPKKSAKMQDSTEFLLNFKAKDAVDQNATICPKCGADMEEDQTECTVCGVDITTGELGKTAAKAQKKTLDASAFYDRVWSDSKKFTKKNKNLVGQTISATMFSLVLSSFLWLVYLWCFKLPPKYFSLVLMILAAVSAVGWPWFLALKVTEATIEKKDRIKKLHSDYFACIALGIKFFVWSALFGFPFLFLGVILMLVMSSSGQPLIGTILAASLLPLIYLPLPIVMAHMSMPVQTPGWLIPKMFPLVLRLWKPTLYWWVIVCVVNLPVFAGVVTSAALYGPTASEFASQIEEQNNILRNHYYKSLTKEGKSDTPPEVPPWPSLMWMIVPAIILSISAVFWGFSLVFSVRALGIFIFTLKKSMDLITEVPEESYTPKSKFPTRKVKPVLHPALNGWLVFFGLSWYPLVAVLGVLSRPNEDPMIPVIIAGVGGLSLQFATAGRWVAFQKFGVPGWACLIPVYNAFIILRMSGWQTKYFAMMIFPWIRKGVMRDVADRWNEDPATFGIGLTAFPFAYWPMLGWNQRMHSDCYVPKEWDPSGKFQTPIFDED